MFQTILLSTLLSLPGSPSAAPGGVPTISSTSHTELERSGRLIVTGAMFDDPGSGARLEIDGQVAIATTWTTEEIHAYVPENATLGAVGVQVVTAAGASNMVSLDVLDREPDGHVAWRFQIDSNLAGQDVAVGPGGEIYVGDDQRLYALQPNGGLEWVLEGASAGYPLAVAADGTIYSWSSGLLSIHPGGTVNWHYVPPVPHQFLICGPTLGPDGNIYAVQDTTAPGGLGVFSVDPSGSLRWSDPGSPQVFDNGGSGTTEVQFAPLDQDRLVFGNNGALPGSPPLLYGFDLSGTQRWTYGSSCNTHPRVDGLGQVIYARSGSCGVHAHDASTGNAAWHTPPPQSIVSTVRAAVGSDGNLYSGDFAGWLWSLRPDGTTRWFVPAPFVVSKLGVSPDGTRLVEGQSDLHTFDTADGTLLWSVDLPGESGFAQLVNTADGPSFSPDSRAAYVTTRFTGNGPGYSYLVALSLDEGEHVGAPYCGPAQTNSTGLPGRLRAWGSDAAADNQLALTAWHLPANQFGLFVVSQTQGFVQPPGSQGFLCLAGNIGRYSSAVQQTGPGGTFSLALDLTQVPTNPPASIQPGETWNWQAWCRDQNPMPTSNFTEALTVTFE